MGKKIRVQVRLRTVRMAGKWFDDECKRVGSLSGKFMPDTLRFLRSLSRRTGPDLISLEVDRDFAERFVLSWRHLFIRYEPTLLLQVRPLPDQLLNGAAAMAEMVSEFQSRLLRKRGHPSTDVDPLAFYRAQKERKASARTRGGAGIADGSLRTLATEWGVDSKNTHYKLVKAGRAFDAQLAKLQGHLPANAEVLFVLADPMDAERGGVACVEIPPPKNLAIK